MEYGVTFPQTEIGTDLRVMRSFVGTAEEAGFTFVTVFDHVLGADSTARPDWTGHYDHTDAFHEPFVLFGWLAAFTSMELMTSVMVLPQRQTVLVAKQAAQVDLLSGGKLLLGVGVGWNDVEYSALGMPFHQRGRRLEEQVVLLRKLWTEDTTSFSGEFESVDRAGILHHPVQRPIPIWIGSMSTAPRVLDRVGRLADGWISTNRPGSGLAEALAAVRDAAEKAGRDPSSLGVQSLMPLTGYDDDAIRRERDVLREIGVTRLNINTMRTGLAPEQHAEAVARLGALLIDS